MLPEALHYLLVCRLSALLLDRRRFNSKDRAVEHPNFNLIRAILGTKTTVSIQYSCPCTFLVLSARWFEHPAETNNLNIKI